MPRLTVPLHAVDGDTNNKNRTALARGQREVILDSNPLFSASSFFWGLQVMCDLQRIPFVRDLVLSRTEPPYSLFSLQEAARSIGLQTTLKKAQVNELATLPLPCLAVLTSSASTQHHRLSLVLRCHGGRVLVAGEKQPNPVAVSIAEFEEPYAGVAILFAPEGKSNTACVTCEK